jgi:hypothetical protein
MSADGGCKAICLQPQHLRIHVVAAESTAQRGAPVCKVLLAEDVMHHQSASFPDNLLQLPQYSHAPFPVPIFIVRG